MYIVEKLKLNKFVQVEIPKNADYFARLGGLMPSIPAGVYSGDELLPVGNKTDLLAKAAEVNDNYLREESEKR